MWVSCPTRSSSPVRWPLTCCEECDTLARNVQYHCSAVRSPIQMHISARVLLVALLLGVASAAMLATAKAGPGGDARKTVSTRAVSNDKCHSEISRWIEFLLQGGDILPLAAQYPTDSAEFKFILSQFADTQHALHSGVDQARTQLMMPAVEEFCSTRSASNS